MGLSCATWSPPGASPYRGYALWRGSYPERLLPPAARHELDDSLFTVCFENGHGVCYLIPDHTRPGKRLVNCAVYLTPPVRLSDPRFLAPWNVVGELKESFERALTSHFPPLWAEVMNLAGGERVSVQPIYDATVTRYAAGRLAVIGDAGALARPHAASGATTALQDTLALERCCLDARTWDEALARYDRERCAAGNTQTKLGRSIGEAMVLHSPDWAAMQPEDFPAWWQATLSGRKTLYE